MPDPESPIDVHTLPKAARDRRLILAREPDSRAAAAFRLLERRLRDSARVIVVSSAERLEGRTTCALNLAAAIAEDPEERVLLAEADVRSPSLSSILGFPPLDCPSPIRVEPLGLHVAPAAPLADRQHPRGAEAARSLTSFREAFDYVVVDAPPILEGAQVNALQDAADGVLVVIMSGRSRGRAVRRALEQIETGPILGLTLFE